MYQRTTILVIVLLLVASGCGAPATPAPTTTPKAAALETEVPTQPPPTATPLPPTNTPEPTPTPRPAGWVTFEMANSPVARTGHALAMLPDGSVLLFGGRDAEGNALGDTWIFGPGATAGLLRGKGRGLLRPVLRPLGLGGDWNQLNPPNAPSARFGHSMVTLPDGKVVMFAGEDAEGVNNDLFVFQNNDWNSVTPGNTPPPPHRDHRSWVRNNGKVHILGGIGPKDSQGIRLLYEDLWFYDPATNKWQQLAGPPGFISPNAYPAVTGSTVHFVDAHGYPYTNGTDYVYHPNEDRWEQVTVTNPPPGQRYGYMTVQVGDKVYMMGGAIYDPDTQTSTYITEVWMLDLFNRIWTQLQDMLPFPTLWGAAVYDPEQHRIIVWGGQQSQEMYVSGSTTQILYLEP